MKNKSLNSRFIKLFCVVIIFLLLCPTVSRGKETGVASLNISMDLMNQRDKTSRSLPEGSTKLTSQKIIFKESDSIEKLLTANGISADGESIGILYRLNPDLDFKSIKAGSEIILPIIKDRQKLTNEFSGGYLVALRLDKELKQDFLRALSELKTSAGETSGLKLQQFESPEAKDKFVGTTKSIVKKIEAFKWAVIYRTRPLSSAMLQQMLYEAEQVQLVLIKIIKDNQEVSKADFETLDLVEKNMNIRMKALVEEKGEGAGGLPAVVETIERVLWNAWFEDADNDSHVEVLKPTNKYNFALDISRFSYFKDYEQVVDLSMQKLIQEALASGKTKIKFVIRPILLGDVVRFEENQGQSRVLEKELEIDITKLVKPKDESVETKNKSMYEDYKAKKVTLRQFAQQVQAGEVKFKMKVNEPGNAALSISIWDQSGMIPLDHLTVPIQVSDPKVSEVKRSVTKQTVPFKAGRGTLLDVSFDFSSTGPLVADAAFHVFEPGQNRNSIVLFAAKTGKEISVYAWETESLLSDYIIDPEQFLAELKKARKRARDKDKDKRQYSYEEAADQLRKKIFTGVTEEYNRQAVEAEKVFSDLVSKKNGAAIVFVRMRNEGGKPVYLPLGILAARSQKPFLDKRIILVQPLPRERYPGGAHPVQAWTFAVPKQLDEVVKDSIFGLALNELKVPDPGPPVLYRDIQQVMGFFKEYQPSAAGAKPEGILLLAHHAGGNLWFTAEGKRIINEDIKRVFPPGSVAILSACSVAAAKGNNQKILEKLNKNDIDAMIISPFPVDANYGTMLSIHFIEALEKAKGLTIADLFGAATAKTTKYFEEKKTINFEDMALEFLIAGDYRISVAPK